jgi:Tfp pilus assembly protein PilN
LWGIRRQKDDPQTGQLSVEVGIIGRRALETLVRSLAKSGINVDHVDIGDSVNAGETIEVDFLRENKTDRIRKRLTATMAALGVVAVIGAGMGTYLALSSMAELEDVEARTDALTSRLRNESSDSGQGTKLADARSLAARKQSEQPAIQIIEALTTLIPDGTWLETLDYEDRKLTVVGRGTSLAPIVEALEKSPVFSEVNIAAATQRDAAANVDSFSISASVDPMSAPP